MEEKILGFRLIKIDVLFFGSTDACTRLISLVFRLTLGRGSCLNLICFKEIILNQHYPLSYLQQTNRNSCCNRVSKQRKSNRKKNASSRREKTAQNLAVAFELSSKKGVCYNVFHAKG
jgi:hypothetical protein